MTTNGLKFGVAIAATVLAGSVALPAVTASADSKTVTV